MIDAELESLYQTTQAHACYNFHFVLFRYFPLNFMLRRPNQLQLLTTVYIYYKLLTFRRRKI
jgi:hypothetical protein